MKVSSTDILAAKALIHLAALFTFFYLLLLLEQNALGADPVKEMIHFLGKTALNFLLITLSISPLARRCKQPLLIQLRRVLGLYCFFWASLHLLVFIWLELDWQLQLFMQEVVKRPYMTLGALTWIILLALSITSITAIRKKMKRAWLTLHRFVYWSVLLAVSHYYWSVKSELVEPGVYFLICLVLLAERKDYFKSLSGRWLQKN
ncbi:protein-methionine-sulfoxide reductase heme-binding subunit MsrQ [Psychromonas sp.]|uniref:protein-methionine-sulfoxide reductase heme-binding subunit MsrQ n=1 Tax=Psychromonas sp. TaxID=1884585 RepID=UPI003561326A